MSETASPTEDPSGSVPAPGPVPVSAPAGACPNCGEPLLGPHCYACGQPRKGLIRQFSSILGDFLDTVLSLDQRTFRTLIPLYFQPGFLTTEYIAGRRVRYVTPLRLYFFLSVVAFLAISLVAHPSIHIGPNGVNIGPEYDAEALAKADAETRTRRLSELERMLAAVPEAQRKEAMADLRQEVEREQERLAKRKGELVHPGVEVEEHFSFNGKRWDPVDNPLRIDWLSEGMNQSLNAEIGELVRKVRSIRKDPAPLVKQVFSLAPQALFVILPLFALLLKLVYVFKRRLYMEHLIVALHSHSFICLSLLVMIALARLEDWTAGMGALPGLFKGLLVAACAWVFAYLLLMQKRVYRQGWLMTLVKFAFVGVCYSVLLTFGMLATFVVGLIVL